MIEQAFIRGAITFAIAGLLTLVLRRRSSAVRHNIWASAIIIQLALLPFVRVLPQVHLPVLPTGHATIDGPIETAERANVATREHAGVVSNSLVRPFAPSRREIDWGRTLFLVWLVGAAMVFARYALGTVLLWRTAGNARRVDEGEWLSLAQRMARELTITRPITLLWGDKLAVPVTWGIFYPMVLLPESADEWSHERRRIVLVHEMAHVRRFDALTQLVAQVTLAVFWFSPFVWLAEWRQRVEREHACDDVVLHHGTEATLYADELLQIVRSLMSRRTAQPAFAAVAMARRSEFEGRMLAILDPHRRRTVASQGLIVAIVSLLIAAPLASLTPTAFNVVTEPSVPTIAPEAKAAPVANATQPCNLAVTSVNQGMDGIVDNNTDKWKIDLKREEPGRCVIARMHGAIMLNSDETAVRDLSANSFVELREVTAKADISARIEASPEGPKTSFVVNGKATPDKDLGRQWIGRVLPQIASEAAYQTDERIRRWLRAHGLRGTLETIARINSTSSLTYHYLALIEARNWSNAELRQIQRAASRTLSKSQSDLDRVLRNMPRDLAATDRSDTSATAISWLERGLSSIVSDGELRAALTTHLGNADKPRLLMLARVASQMSSGYELRSYLTTASSYMLTKRDRDLENAWFTLANKLGSSYERRQALTTAIAYAYGNPRVQNLIAESAAGMSSDQDRLAVLSALSSVR